MFYVCTFFSNFIGSWSSFLQSLLYTMKSLCIWQTALGFLDKLLADVNLLIDKEGALSLLIILLYCDNRIEAINWREKKNTHQIHRNDPTNLHLYSVVIERFKTNKQTTSNIAFSHFAHDKMYTFLWIDWNIEKCT